MSMYNYIGIDIQATVKISTNSYVSMWYEIPVVRLEFVHVFRDAFLRMTELVQK